MAVVEQLFEVIAYLRTSGDDLVVKGRTYADVDTTGDVRTLILRDFVSYPDSRAYKLVFQYQEPITEIDYNTTIYLTPSRAYNFSFWVKQSDPILIEGYGNITESRNYKETNVLIASENSVPFYFPVETSYKVGGNIKDLSLMVEQITDSQTGQWPIVILTDKGIFALEQGSGIVLYSNLIPISNDICSAGSVQTPRGVVYISNRAVNILVGRNAANISAVLEGPIDTNIREDASFLLATASDELYDISDHLSIVDFRDYLVGAVLLFDTNKNEIIVSNVSYKYSYVFNLPSQSWYKTTSTYLSGKGRLALQKNSSAVDLVDITDEYYINTTRMVHAQSRPLKLESEGYKTIYRAILRGELLPVEPFGAYIFGSNDLIEWNMISAAQTESDCANLRLFRSKCSYRYFIFCTGGIVKINSNIAYIDLEIDDKLQSKLR